MCEAHIHNILSENQYTRQCVFGPLILCVWLTHMNRTRTREGGGWQSLRKRKTLPSISQAFDEGKMHNATQSVYSSSTNIKVYLTSYLVCSLGLDVHEHFALWDLQVRFAFYDVKAQQERLRWVSWVYRRPPQGYVAAYLTRDFGKLETSAFLRRGKSLQVEQSALVGDTNILPSFLEFFKVSHIAREGNNTADFMAGGR